MKNQTVKEAPHRYPQCVSFRADVQPGDTAEIEMVVDGVIVTFSAVIHPDHGITPMEFDGDPAAHAKWKRGEFEYVGVVVGWSVKTLHMGDTHAYGLWGVENWYDKASAGYLAAIAHELIAEAAADVAATLADARGRLCMMAA